MAIRPSARTSPAVLSVVVLLAGCAGSTGATAPAATVTVPAPTTDSVHTATRSWANGVCAASTELETSIDQVGGAVRAALSGAAGSPDQLRQGTTAVQHSMDKLWTAISSTPPRNGAGLSAAEQQLTSAAEAAREKVDGLAGAAGKAANSHSRQEIAMALASVATSLATAAAGVQHYLSQLRITVSSQQSAVRDAFAAAPACAARAKSSPIR